MPKAGATVDSWMLDALKSGRGEPADDEEEESSYGELLPPLPLPRLLLLIADCVSVQKM